MTGLLRLRPLLCLATLLLAGFCLALWPLAAQAATILVDGTICTLPNAITAANTDGLVAGCLTPGNDADTLVLNPIVYTFTNGPFADNGANALPSITSTITISGNGAIIERSGSEHFRFFHVAPITGNLTLENVTLRYGNIAANGGAIFNQGVLVLSNSRIVSNSASFYGGGIYNEHGTVTLTDSQILSNSAENGGGGIFSQQGAISLSNSYVLSNTVLDADGGGIFNNNGTATLTNTYLVANSAGGYGGGIINSYGNTTLSGVHVVANTVGHNGGGVYNVNGGTVTLTDTHILSNTAAIDGGGLDNETDSTASVSDSEIVSNTAENVGGGVLNYGGTSIFTATAIVANMADSAGGGLYVADGVVSLIQSRLLQNRAGQDGGAIQQDDGSTTITQSCIVGNSATAVNYAAGAPLEAGNNWWGASDGPGGIGPGAGDSVSSNVNFDPILASEIADCSIPATGSAIYLPSLKR